VNEFRFRAWPPFAVGANTMGMSTKPTATPRLQRPERHQMKMDLRALDQLLPPDHFARAVWAYVEPLDLSPLLARIKAVVGNPGQPAIDPRILLSLWLLATLDGVGSARELDRLTREHLAYEWLCGAVSVNYHTLSDFRSDNEEFLSQLLTQSVAVLMQQGLVELQEVSQDGLRVRASAGAQSFRREKSLRECLQKAEEQVAALRKQLDEDDGAVSRRQQAAWQRAARERQERIAEALRQRQQLAERQAEVARDKGAKRKKEPRASTTDPEARTMKMPDGGYRPGYNVELATDTTSGLVVGVDVINVGSDSGQLRPMIEQIETRYQRKPQRALADGDFAHLDDIETLHADHQVEVYAPVRNAERQKAQGNDPYQPKPKDKPGVGLWRTRMGTEEAQTIYRRRAQTAEWTNARVRNWGLRQVLVRGLQKVRAVALLYALAHNLRQTLLLRTRAVTVGSG
jgi:transposase